MGTAFEVTTADGAVLTASRDGEGPALLLVSGLGGTASFWGPTIPALSAHFDVIRFDQRGIGGATRGTAPVDIAQLARDAVAVLDAAGVEKAILVGHSTGGCIGQAVAHTMPERLTALALSATWLRPSHYMSALFQTRRAILADNPEAYAATAALLAFPPDWLEANFAQYGTSVAKAPKSEAARTIVRERIDALLAFDGRDKVGAITMPTIVIGAVDDMIVPVFLQRELAEALPSPRLELYPSGGHFFPISRTDLFTTTLIDWAATLA
ncbi:alpha/beta fold hydrolase [Acuticoccus kandeliae]|uniref:alpha/beta fold hydrolase n=1 Tax=Acuticoccus kandeliae TaxID=2073160 RepID=UPI000D3E3D44|nr:alpha/beta fold hydrolase [Acuticoccus kandeliae]